MNTLDPLDQTYPMPTPLENYRQHRDEEFEKSFPYSDTKEYSYYYHDIKSFSTETTTHLIEMFREDLQNRIENHVGKRQFARPSVQIVHSGIIVELEDILSKLPNQKQS